METIFSTNKIMNNVEGAIISLATRTEALKRFGTNPDEAGEFLANSLESFFVKHEFSLDSASKEMQKAYKMPLEALFFGYTILVKMGQDPDTFLDYVAHTFEKRQKEVEEMSNEKLLFLLFDF